MASRARTIAFLFLAWLPFLALWTLAAISLGRLTLAAAFFSSAFNMGMAALLGVGVWHLCRRFPWPLSPPPGFFLLQVVLACGYAALWNAAACGLESLYRGENLFPRTLASPVLPWQLLTGVWIYGLLAGVSYAVQTRRRAHEQELVALRASTLLAQARLEALRARLNPHFLFNALHSLGALVRFHPAQAQDAIERLGDLLRYALKEDGRALVELSEELEFTERYLAFEKLRHQDRLRIEVSIEPAAERFEVPPFSIQTLAENAVHHAISVRPEGGRISIAGACGPDRLEVTVRDDGPGGAAEPDSHQSGLNSLRERLFDAFGAEATLHVQTASNGTVAKFSVPLRGAAS